MRLIVGILIYTCNLVVADLASDFEKTKIIPDSLDKAPNELITVIYNDKKVEFGKELTPTFVKYAPVVEMNYDPSSFYTLIMTDLDPPSPDNPKYREFIHWLVKNIPGDDFSKGEILVEYAGSGPPEDGGIHRALFLLYKQPGKLIFNETYTGDRILGWRLYFNQKSFSEKYNLGDPIAGNMFIARFDDYVPTLHAEFIKNLG